MITTIGQTIVGYRYGKAPEGGKSWNYREGQYECGVSMASVGYAPMIGSFAVSGANTRKKYYYIGTICGTGGDDEICLSDVRRITYQEYLKLRKDKDMIAVSNQVINDRIDTRIGLINDGWSIGWTIDDLENERNKYLK